MTWLLKGRPAADVQNRRGEAQALWLLDLSGPRRLLDLWCVGCAVFVGHATSVRERAGVACFTRVESGLLTSASIFSFSLFSSVATLALRHSSSSVDSSEAGPTSSSPSSW